MRGITEISKSRNNKKRKNTSNGSMHSTIRMRGNDEMTKGRQVSRLPEKYSTNMSGGRTKDRNIIRPKVELKEKLTHGHDTLQQQFLRRKDILESLTVSL